MLILQACRMVARGRWCLCTAGRTSGSSTASMTRSCRSSTARRRRESSVVSPTMEPLESPRVQSTQRGMRWCSSLINVILLNRKETPDIYSFRERSILTSCIGKSDSEDDLSLGVKRPISPGQAGTTWTGAGGAKTDEADGFDENYFRRRPKSFYFEGRRFGGDPGVRMSHIADENYLRSMTMVTIFLNNHINISWLSVVRVTRPSLPEVFRCSAILSLSSTRASVRPWPGRRCSSHRTLSYLSRIPSQTHRIYFFTEKL